MPSGSKVVSADVKSEYEKEEEKSIERRRTLSKKQKYKTDKPVKWTPNDISDECKICKNFFNLFRRRHHCRQCGQ